MNFAYPALLWLLPITLVVLAIMIAGDVARRKGLARFGSATLLDSLVTADGGPRRVVKAALRLLALFLAIFAMARPRYGRGTKTVPASDVTAMVVLDISKSMYAQDVLPSRLERARNDIARMVKAIPTIRWGAVAFAGEAVAFPPTTDAPEVINYLKGHEPHSMPGGTAIAKALEVARRQLVPQPQSTAENAENKAPTRRQKPVIVLVTDGEDLQGDPVAVARNAFNDGIRIHVALVGARAPQPIPDIDPDSGLSQGYVRDEFGKLVTTELSPQAENQLRSIAQESKGVFVHAIDGTTGLAQIESELKSMMAFEGTERVETLFADIYHWPLGIAFALLVLDAFIGEARRRKHNVQSVAAPPTSPQRSHMALSKKENAR